MRRISALEQQIRNYVNDTNLYKRCFNGHLDEWNTLCVAMDTIGDTCLSLEYYEASGIGNEHGEKYLKLYGLLQAIFLQQDSIRQIYRIFLGSNLKLESDSAWMRIRNLRNMTVGHPIERKHKTETKRYFISRVTIHSDGFQLIIWDKDKEQKEFEDVSLKPLYEEYKTEAAKHLESIYQAKL
jgi:hypothetical protein